MEILTYVVEIFSLGIKFHKIRTQNLNGRQTDRRTDGHTHMAMSQACFLRLKERNQAKNSKAKVNAYTNVFVNQDQTRSVAIKIQ
jgi:hypothetical protein